MVICGGLPSAEALQAATDVVLVQLGKLDGFMARRRALAQRYATLLDGVPVKGEAGSRLTDGCTIAVGPFYLRVHLRDGASA